GRLARVVEVKKVVLGALIAIGLVALALAGFTRAREAAFDEKNPPPGKRVEVGGARMHAIDKGSGEPAIVFVHGNPGTALDFEGVQDALAKKYRTVALDRPGYGWSDRPALEMSATDQARSVKKVLDALGVQRPVLVGFSFGGTVALSYAEEFPAGARALVLL